MANLIKSMQVKENGIIVTKEFHAKEAENAENVTSKIGDRDISNIFDGSSTTVKNALNATNAVSATNATNVTTNINGVAISTIFETNGTTVKNATNASNAETAVSAGSATTANSASNVTSTIANIAISEIFDTDGKTVKKAKEATSANSASIATTASKLSYSGSGSVDGAIDATAIMNAITSANSADWSKITGTVSSNTALVNYLNSNYAKSSDLNSYLTKSEASSNYLTTNTAVSTYLTKEDAESGYVRKNSLVPVLDADGNLSFEINNFLLLPFANSTKTVSIGSLFPQLGFYSESGNFSVKYKINGVTYTGLSGVPGLSGELTYQSDMYDAYDTTLNGLVTNTDSTVTCDSAGTYEFWCEEDGHISAKYTVIVS